MTRDSRWRPYVQVLLQGTGATLIATALDEAAARAWLQVAAGVVVIALGLAWTIRSQSRDDRDGAPGGD